MKIIDVKTFVMGTAWRNLVYVKVYTDEGLTGVGEATVQNREEGVIGYIDGLIRRHVLGSDPFNIEDLWLRMYRDEFWRGGVIATSGMSAIEIACWDIVGKAVGQPVYRLMGGQVRDRIKVYANGWYTGERTPEEFAERARLVVTKGYKALKVDPFGNAYYEMERKEKLMAVSLVEAIRDAVGPDVEIMIEMHGRLTPATAIEMARELAPFNPAFYEEPVPPENLDAMAKVAAHITIPLATGERYYTRYDYWRLLQAQVADIIQPDIIHCGGLLEAKKIAAMADANYVTVAPHNSNGPVTTAVSTHFAACTPNFKILEVFDDFAEPWVVEAVPGTPRVVDGYLSLPEGPGLGIDLNEGVMAEHPYRKEVFFNEYAVDWHKRKP
jgi:galactonate dehydratase